MANALPQDALDQIFVKARSYNGYLDKPVSEADLHAIWELLKWGPTSANQLPARFVWVTSQESKEKLAALTSGTNGPKILKAPVTVIIGMDENFHEHLPELFPPADAKSWFDGNEALRKTSAFRNGTLQGAYFLIAARALGFDTGPMSGFDNAAVDAAFFADTPHVKSNFISTLGYGNPASIFGRLPRPEFGKFNRID